MKDLAFDLDGVLIDALHIHRAAFIEAWQTATGLTWLDEAFHDEHLASLSTRQKLRKLVAMGFLLNEQVDTISDLKQRLTLDRIDEAPSTVPWLRELLGSLRYGDGRRLALVSNSIRKTCLRTLENNAILEFFDVIVASDDVKEGYNKPSSLPYTTAATELGCATTGDLVAFEDSAAGLRSAKAAGCWVYVVSRPSVDLEEAKVRSWLKIIDAA